VEIRLTSNGMNEESLISLLKVNPQVKKLTIDSVNQSNLTSAILTCIAQYNTAIKEVVLSKFNQNISLVEVTNVILSCPQLAHLMLSVQPSFQYFLYQNSEHYVHRVDCSHDKTKSVQVVGLKHLTESGLEDCSELEHFFKAVHNINEIKIASCIPITDQLLFILTHSHRNLRTISLCDCGDKFSAEWLQKVLFANSTSIGKVELQHAFHITSKELAALFDSHNSFGVALHTIGIHNHLTLDDHTVMTILHTNPTLQRLELTRNKTVDMGAFHEFVATNYPHVNLTIR